MRRLAEGGLVAALTATSPARLAHPDGGEPLAGTNPLAIAIPSSDGEPLVADVSMGAVTYGDVLRGAATPEELVPFGGEQAHKAFALALGLELLVDALAGDGYGAVLLVARPEADPGRRRCASARPGYASPRQTRSGARSSSSSAHFSRASGSSSSARSSARAAPRRAGRRALDAREVVVAAPGGRAARRARLDLGDRALGILVDDARTRRRSTPRPRSRACPGLPPTASTVVPGSSARA